MKAKAFFSSAFLMAGLAVLVLSSRSSSQDSRLLIDGFRLGQPDNRMLINDKALWLSEVPGNVSVQPRQPHAPLPDGTEFSDHIIGTLIDGSVNDFTRATPAFQFDTARPLVVEYMELHGKLAERLTDEELEAEITELRQTLQVLDAEDELKEVRQSLQRLIENHPDTPAAEAAQRALDQLEAADQPPEDANPFFNLDDGGLKPAGGNRPFD